MPRRAARRSETVLAALALALVPWLLAWPPGGAEAHPFLPVAAALMACAALAHFWFWTRSVPLLMPVFLVRRWGGELEAREGQQLAWVSAEEIGSYPAPAADIPLFAQFIDWSKAGRA